MAAFKGNDCLCKDQNQDQNQRVSSVLKTLHSVKHIVNEEECRSVGKAIAWWRELVVVIVAKPPGAVQETLVVLEEYKEEWWYNITARGIEILNELFTRRLITSEEFPEAARKARWVDYLNHVLLTKPAEVVQEACQVLETLEKCNWSVKELPILKELFTRHVLTSEDFPLLVRKGTTVDHLTEVLVDKPVEVVQEACQVLEKHGCPVKKLRTLNELFTRHLLTAKECSEVTRKRWWEWEDHLHQVLSTKPAEVVQEACQVLEKHGLLVKKKLTILNELFTRHLLTAEEFPEVARRGRRLWKDHLAQVLFNKPAEVVQEACPVLEKHGCPVKKELKILNELFTRHLLTAEECSEMTREDHLYQALSTKPVEVVQEACQVLLEHGCSVKKLKTLNELFSRHLLAAEECSEVARKGKRHRRWEYYLVQVLSTKPAELVQEACQVLEKHGYPEKEELKALNELFTRHLLTAEECSHMARKGRRHRMGNIFVMRNEDYLTQVLTKPAEVVQEACEVLEKHGCRVKKELKMLSELYQEKLVTEDEVKRMKGGRLSDRVVRAHCTKPLKVVARTTNVLDKYGHNEDARQLRALNELFTRHLLTAEECYAMLARKKRRWEDHLTEVLLTKPAEVVQEACQMLEKHGYPVKKELKMLLELYQEKLVTEDVVKWMKGERGHLSDRVVHVQCTKTPEVVARTTNVLDKYEHNKEARLLRALSELFTRHLLTAEECSEVARKREWEWEDRLNQVLLAKPAEVVPEACQVIEKHGCSVKKLQSLNELFTRHLLTAEECSEVAGKREWCWENHLNQVLLTKPAEVVQDACQVLKKHGCSVNKELKKIKEAVN